jgi:hypothetical protein
MKAINFYKKVLSIKVPIIMFVIGVFYTFDFIYIEKLSQTNIILFIFIFFSLIIITESLIAFIRTKRIIKNISNKETKRIIFPLLIIPFLPAIIGTLIYSLCKIVLFGILFKREFIIALGTTLLINYLFSIIYNCNIKTFDYI